MPSAPPRPPRVRTRRLAAMAAAPVLAAVLALGVSAPAQAAALQCSASALRGAVLGQPALEPVVANGGDVACASKVAGGAAASAALSALPLNATVLGAATTVTAPDVAKEKQAALAQGGLAALTVKALPTLPITLPTASIPPSVGSITIPTPPLVAALGTILTPIPSTLTFDLTAAVNALLPNGQLPNVEVVSLGSAVAYAGYACQRGVATKYGLSQVADLKVLGQTVPTDVALDQVLSLIDTQNIDLTQLNPALIPLPTGLSPLVSTLLTPLLSTVQSLVVGPLIAALPPISIPATVANVKLTPSSQTVTGDRLVQQGPRLQVSILGQSIADVIVGEAIIAGTDGVDCTPAAAPTVPPETAADLALECTTRSLVLVDVLRQGNRVKLLGAADRKLAGRTVSLRLAAQNRTVATAKIAPDGSFSALAPLPPKAIRSTNAARYQAVLGTEKSLDLKLERRMIVSSLSAEGGKVTIAGRVTLPLSKPTSSITLTRRVSCKRSEVVKRFLPKADGTFSVTVPAPSGEAAAVYRLATRVRRTVRSMTTSPTFTLPRGVNLTR